jgi:nucleotide-binding universal stress UspA family protein
MRYPMTFRRILHPTDFSTCSAPAFAVACSLAADLGAEVVVLHVAPLTAVVRASGVSLVTSDDAEELNSQLRRIVPTPPGVRLSHRLEHGEPDVVIPRVADECHADLIVMGTHGRTGLLDRMLLGSVAEKVVRTAHRPVMTVPVAGSALTCSSTSSPTAG